MRKLLLLTAITIVGISSTYSQEAVNRNISLQQSMFEEKSVVSQQAPGNNKNNNQRTATANSRSVTNGVKLNSQRIGSAGNLLSVEFANTKQLDVNDSINCVTFIHRNDPTIPGATGTNVAQYRYDISKDGGNTWQSNIGPITNSSLIDNITVNGRFPQGGIYNPVGNTIADSAFLIYSGTWHNSPPSGTTGSWQGQMRGRGNLSGDTSTFNVHIDQVNNGKVSIATGFCQTQPGVFWNLNEDFSGSFASGSSQIVYGLLVEKGIWNPATRDIQWNLQNIPQTFDSSLSGTVYASNVTSFNMAFDQSGKYGWIGCLGAIDPLDSSFNPIFWRSVDSGATWTGPILVNLAKIPSVVNQLHAVDISSNATSRIPTTAFDQNMVVDYLGNPHMVVVVGNRALTSPYALATGAGYTAWDITYNSNIPACSGDTGVNGWRPVFLDSVQTLRGTFSKDNPALQQDNRPMAARSRDGKKVFFYWLDSDINIEGSDNNSNPNLFTRAFDLEHFTSTNPINLTLGDSLWGGTTVTTPGGVIGGATFGVCSEIAHQVGSTYNVPLVLTQIDYTVPPGTLGSADQPAAFWYINNINYDPYDFTNSLAASVTLVGSDSIILLHGQTYVESGAQISYLDTSCYHTGPLHLVIDSSAVNSNVDGSYYVHYMAEDDNGNVYASANRQVTVGSPPIAFFTYTHGVYPYKIQFQDASLNNPTDWYWQYGDNTSTYGYFPNPPVKVYHADGTYNVCLTVYNGFGQADTCLKVAVTGVGLNDISFAENIDLYPNPTSGKVSLAIQEQSISEFTVSVLDMLGKEVVVESRYQAGTSKVDMDLSSLSSGVYLVKVTASNGTAIKYLNIDNH